MTPLNYTIAFNTKNQWSWKKLSFIKVDNYQVIEQYSDTDYCPHTCFSETTISKRSVSEHSNYEEAASSLSKWSTNLTNSNQKQA